VLAHISRLVQRDPGIVPQFSSVDGLALAESNVMNGGGPNFSITSFTAAAKSAGPTDSWMMSRWTGLKTQLFAW